MNYSCVVEIWKGYFPSLRVSSSSISYVKFSSGGTREKKISPGLNIRRLIIPEGGSQPPVFDQSSNIHKGG